MKTVAANIALGSPLGRAGTAKAVTERVNSLSVFAFGEATSPRGGGKRTTNGRPYNLVTTMSIIEIKQNNLISLAAENILVPHGFTTRMGGVSEGYLSSLNLGMHRGDDPENVAENYRRLAKAVGFDVKNLVLANQTHSDIVRVVTEADCMGSLSHRDYPECDGLVTNTPGVALMVFSADCTPILLHDPVTGAVGAVHAGWRGTASGIAKNAVETTTDPYRKIIWRCNRKYGKVQRCSSPTLSEDAIKALFVKAYNLLMGNRKLKVHIPKV